MCEPNKGSQENPQCILQRRILKSNQSFTERSRIRLTPSVEEESFRVYIVRHGHSISNQDPKVLQVCSDHTVPLSRKGKREAEACADFINKKLEEDSLNTLPRKYSLWVSPYKRTRETAQILENLISAKITKRRESIFLGEQQFGLFEGLPLSELSKKYPYEYSHFEKAIEYGGRFWARMPLGESRFDIAVRLQSVIEKIKEDRETTGITDVIIVTHGVTARVLAMMLLNNTPEWLEVEPNPKNCSVRLIESGIDKGYIFKGFGGNKRPRPTTPQGEEIEEPGKKKAKISDVSQNWVHSSEDKNLLASLLSNIARLEQQLVELKTQAKEAFERCTAQSLPSDETSDTSD